MKCASSSVPPIHAMPRGSAPVTFAPEYYKREAWGPVRTQSPRRATDDLEKKKKEKEKKKENLEDILVINICNALHHAERVSEVFFCAKLFSYIFAVVVDRQSSFSRVFCEKEIFFETCTKQKSNHELFSLSSCVCLSLSSCVCLSLSLCVSLCFSQDFFLVLFQSFSLHLSFFISFFLCFCHLFCCPSVSVSLFPFFLSQFCLSLSSICLSSLPLYMFLPSLFHGYLCGYYQTARAVFGGGPRPRRHRLLEPAARASPPRTPRTEQRG